MVSLIKNQIIKHLSTFARNLTPDQISVEVLRGKGELKNIELNEVVLTERLELPSWLKIVRATCNRVSVKVPWTKLKMSAVELSIDEIEVVLSLSAASPTAVPKKANTRSGKAYDFGERVIEGLSISVQTLSVHFTSDCFGGSIMFQRLSVASKSPQFKNQADLHLTRVHDKSINQLIFFKQVSWEMCKIEASALHGSDVKVDADDTRHNALNSPLRLIMHNGGKCKIAIKKNDLNCSMISARIEVHLDEILWVATLLQLRSAIDFYKHIQNLVKASEQDNVGSFLIDMPQQKQNANANTTNLPAKPTATNPISLAFQKYDIPRSSHHFRISKIDLCLFDDSNDNVLPTDWDINNGAIQAVLHELCVDYYPSHAVFVNGAFADRSDWVRYNAFNSCRGLTERHLNNYYAKICENFELGLSARIQRVWPSLHSRNVVLRIEDIVVQCVSEQKTTKDSIQQLFAPSKLRRFADMPSIPTISFLHMEFASYYFLASNGYPLPPDTSHLVIGPLDFLADGRSIRWMVYVFENIFNAFDESLDMLATANQPYFCAEFVEPTVIFNAPQLTDDSRLPTRFLLNFSSVSVCNFLLPTPTTSSFQPLTIGDLAFSPFNALARLTAKCRAFAAGRQSTLSRYLDFGELMKRVDLFGDAVDYANSIDSVYRTIDDIRLYVNIPSLSFVSDFGWNSFETPIVTDSSLLIVVAPQKPIGAALVHLRSDVLVTVDHFQLVRLIQLQNQISDLVDQIDNDRRFFAGHNTVPTMADESTNDNFSFAVLCDLRNVNVSLVLPIAPLPSPYDFTWSPPSMTLENTPDSIATPPIIDSS